MKYEKWVLLLVSGSFQNSWRKSHTCCLFKYDWVVVAYLLCNSLNSELWRGFYSPVWENGPLTSKPNTVQSLRSCLDELNGESVCSCRRDQVRQSVKPGQGPVEATTGWFAGGPIILTDWLFVMWHLKSLKVLLSCLEEVVEEEEERRSRKLKLCFSFCLSL